MRLVRCDECRKEVPEGTDPVTRNTVVHLVGYRNPKGDILLPEHMLRHDFCSRACFEAWIRRREGLQIVEEHREKYASLYDLVEKAREKKIDTVVIHHPGVLGDNYAELVANLDMLAEAKLAITIVPPADR